MGQERGTVTRGGSVSPSPGSPGSIKAPTGTPAPGGRQYSRMDIKEQSVKLQSQEVLGGDKPSLQRIDRPSDEEPPLSPGSPPHCGAPVGPMGVPRNPLRPVSLSARCQPARSPDEEEFLPGRHLFFRARLAMDLGLTWRLSAPPPKSERCPPACKLRPHPLVPLCPAFPGRGHHHLLPGTVLHSPSSRGELTMELTPLSPRPPLTRQEAHTPATPAGSYDASGPNRNIVLAPH
ncbi:hypothetical protein DPEC_G00244570 [Dallia pectoralis]|uniref:Uncharacterized protein n=1 Tax=Dallia pectoralis TaxID=75939 RepID=A0ACC2FVM7_DALPE|nr:hypothetical protein DPEC_G00244570 [Dallia pectoralis]